MMQLHVHRIKSEAGDPLNTTQVNPFAMYFGFWTTIGIFHESSSLHPEQENIYCWKQFSGATNNKHWMHCKINNSTGLWMFQHSKLTENSI